MGKKDRDNQKHMSERAVDPLSRVILSAAKGRKEQIDQTNFLIYFLDPLGFSILLIGTSLPAIAILLLFGVLAFIIAIAFVVIVNSVILFFAKRTKKKGKE